MMAVQTVFKRYELKYMITRAQKAELVAYMQPYMRLDQYGHTTIRNLYYDTDTYRLVRRSNEKPVYKEKLRARSYGLVGEDDIVFVELKKKYNSVVYKRRMALPQNVTNEWLRTGHLPPEHSQIEEEIEYFREYYESLTPKVFLSYEREAFYDITGSDFRVTFDENVLARTDRLSLSEDVGGIPLLEKDKALMEIKCSGGIPLWMTRWLTEHKVYKTSFSKYGTAYNKIIYKYTNAYKGDYSHVG